MRWTLGLCCLLGSLTAARASPAPFGYLYQPAYSLDAQPRLPAEAYSPQPGDLLLPNNPSLFATISYFLAGSGRPSHSAVVFALPDGSPAVLEAWATKGAVVAVTPLQTWLVGYKGKIWCRRRKTAISEEQSSRLTEFALLNDKKSYAFLRVVAQVTPFRHRGYFRSTYIGRPHGIRKTYYCSEIVLEAMVYAGLLDPETTRPTATYPRDMFFDRSHIPYIDRHLGLACEWHVPALWTRCPCACR